MAWMPFGYPAVIPNCMHRNYRNRPVGILYVSMPAGIPILAECGGAMLLCKALVDLNGSDCSMAGVFPCVSIMQTRLVALGHREEASGVKGHEFHYSTREKSEGLPPAFDVSQGDKGVRYKNVRVSYIHWFFAEVNNQACAWFKTVS